MSDEPKSFWGKLAVTTAFLTALVSIVTVMQQCTFSDTNNSNIQPSKVVTPQADNPVDFDSFDPDYPAKRTPRYTPANNNSYNLYCCDMYGNKWCQIVINPGPVGTPCFCAGVTGTGYICQ
ncbi:hypothetical protein [Zooshikella harenae]|uniref:EGF-like domain-containing protein n=1 Tax=Zooshikella harenae TaxID=2827238 RepID=A0ABS5ZB95_9GAMM|nr:hypothetical protein [Zooshikella harenae]MBU2711337.1 hypothetical protein [Zooshikella harenae]